MGKIITFKEAIFDTVTTEYDTAGQEYYQEALIWIANKPYKVWQEDEYNYWLENDFDLYKRGIDKKLENDLYIVKEVKN